MANRNSGWQGSINKQKNNHPKKILVHDSNGNWSVSDGNSAQLNVKTNHSRISNAGNSNFQSKDVLPYPESWLSPEEEKRRLKAGLEVQLKAKYEAQLKNELRKAYDAGHSAACHHYYDREGYVTGDKQGEIIQIIISVLAVLVFLLIIFSGGISFDIPGL